MIVGLALLVASVLAGGLWTALGPGATFTVGAAFAALAGIGVRRSSPNPEAQIVLKNPAAQHIGCQ